jgi:hypothetical protein
MSRVLWDGVFAFVAGVLSSNYVVGAWQMVRGSTEQRCLTRSVCAGDDIRQVFDHRDQIGGLTLRICGEGSGARYDAGADLVAGTPCASDTYALEFRRRGPLHVIDF